MPTKTKPKVIKKEAPVEWTPSLDEKCLFTGEHGEFIASIKSFDPLQVIQHQVENGVQTEREIVVGSLEDFEITQLDVDEAFRRLA